MRSEIPLLQNVRVASPCRASWEAMAPVDGDRVRFCDGCRKRVYNLSALCQAEAEGLLRAHEGHLCVRYYRRGDGTILTEDCPVGLRAARRVVLARTKATFGACLALCAAFALFAAQQQATTGTPIQAAVTDPEVGLVAASEPPHVAIAGKISVSPPPIAVVHESPVMGDVAPTRWEYAKTAEDAEPGKMRTGRVVVMGRRASVSPARGAKPPTERPH